MAGRRRSNTDEFSLLNMNEDIRDAAQNLLAALDKLGVSANADMLFTGIQTLVSQAAMTSGNSMLASDGMGVKGKGHMPYSMTADFFATAFENFHNGKKRDAVNLFLQACDLDDSNDLIQGLVTMNSNSAHVQKLIAEESGDMPGDENPEGEDLGGEDLSDEEIDDLIEDSEAGSSDGADAEDKAEETDGEAADDADTGDDALAGSPMDPDAPPKAMTASASDRVKTIMARKASSSGSHDDRTKAARILKV